MSVSQDEQKKDCNEQELCIRCGLCCDGTIFESARICDEDLAYLENNPMDFIVDIAHRNFLQPCHYHVNRCCSIYLKWRPGICSRFVCKVIHQLRNGELAFDQATGAIELALSHAAKIRKRLVSSDGHDRQNLGSLLKSYVAAHPVPDPSVMLEYAAFQYRLKRDFFKCKHPENASCNDGTSVKQQLS